MDHTPINLVTAFVLGLLDSLFGHSRALIAGYFLDARRPASHAVLLTLILVVTHTFMLVGLTSIAHLARTQIPQESVEKYLELIAGGLMIGLGAWMLRRNWGTPGDECCHLDAHHHHRHHEEIHAQSLKQVWILGISGSIVPCANGLAVLMQAAASRNLFFSGVILFSFSLGLGISVFGLSLVAQRAAGRLAHHGWSRRLPMVSAILILLMGIISLGQTIFEVHR